MAVSAGREYRSTDSIYPVDRFIYNAKLIAKALLILEKMWKSSCESDLAAYMILIRSLCNAQKADIALEFYKEMVHKEMGLDMSLYELLLTCLAGCGDIIGVQLVVDDMIRHSHIAE
ncbi:hypothetical protein PVL29_013683 [Vitis rotundifolia]|uniref:Pentatricopeptide repeat-containing protein n=1 Tax=Vitis rotundifolia TaxID=103349 RepID=A0AA39DNV2_VITRO|nr:hypothetical protein PVL29_013683 [Vitis rotundifolia]